jgi:hypothetical protein
VLEAGTLTLTGAGANLRLPAQAAAVFRVR